MGEDRSTALSPGEERIDHAHGRKGGHRHQYQDQQRDTAHGSNEPLRSSAERVTPPNRGVGGSALIPATPVGISFPSSAYRCVRSSSRKLASRAVILVFLGIQSCSLRCWWARCFSFGYLEGSHTAVVQLKLGLINWVKHSNQNRQARRVYRPVSQPQYIHGIVSDLMSFSR